MVIHYIKLSNKQPVLQCKDSFPKTNIEKLPLYYITNIDDGGFNHITDCRSIRSASQHVTQDSKMACCIG